MLALLASSKISEGRARVNGYDLLAKQAKGLLNMVAEIIEDRRTCRKCGETKEIAFFGKPRVRPSGWIEHKRQCLACENARCRAWVRRNHEKNDSRTLNPNQMRSCTTCGKTKKAVHFGLSRSALGGISLYCLDCSRTRDRGRYEKNRDARRTQAKWGVLKMERGMSRDEFIALFESQGGSCAICSGELSFALDTEPKKRACVDHCHRSGKVRGILCVRCNQGIGLLQDSSLIASSAARYLSGHGAF